MKNRVEMLLMSKRQLEDYGRTIGIELDRRKTKTHLIKELLDHGKSMVSASVSIPDIDSAPLVVVPKVEEVVNTAKYGLVQQGGFWSVSEGIKEVYKSSSKKNALRFIKKRS
jgi:hypothetical protein